MNISLILLALGLSADAFAVALGQGAVSKFKTWRTALAVGAAFGIAQALAPLIGWSLGYTFAGLIESFDHWIAFGLLATVGAKMLWEGLRKDPPGVESDPGKERLAGGWALLALAVATSIDAAAAGITLPTIGAPLGVSVAVIGVATFLLSAIGVFIGRAGSKAIGPQAEVVGGVILIVIGAKVLVDHHAFG